MPTKPKAKKQLYSLPTKKGGQWSSKGDTFYHSSRWRKLRLQVLTANPLCIDCLNQNKTTLANVCDHIKPVRLGGETWNIENLQGLCEACHNTKTNKESRI